MRGRNCSQLPVKIRAVDNKCKQNIACSCRGRYPNLEIILGKTFLYNFEAAPLLKASNGCMTEKRNFHHYSYVVCISTSQKKNNSALKYVEIYLKYLAYTGTMPSEEPSDSNKWRGTLDVVLCKWEVRPVLLPQQLHCFLQVFGHDKIKFGKTNALELYNSIFSL